MPRERLNGRLLDEASDAIRKVVEDSLQRYLTDNFQQPRLSKKLVEDVASRLSEIALLQGTNLGLDPRQMTLLRQFENLNVSTWPRQLLAQLIDGISSSLPQSRLIESKAGTSVSFDETSSDEFWYTDSEKVPDAELTAIAPSFSKPRISQLEAEIADGFLTYAKKYREAMVVPTEEQLVAVEYVKKWAAVQLGNSNLDDEQALAIASVVGHNQILARAGSGKTTVLTIRLCFLILECKMAPDSILALTFNRKAKDELLSRVRRHLIFNDELTRGGFESAKRLDSAIENDPDHAEKLAKERAIDLPLIMTFHGLAFQILAANLGEKAPRQIEGEDGAKNIRLEKIIRRRLKDVAGDTRLRLILRQYFQDDWEWLTDIAGHPKDLMEIRKHLSYETLRGEKVKSHGERKIANWLFKSGIAYGYESGVWTKERYLFPDFSILQSGNRVGVVEYVGLIGEPGYDADLKKKVAAYNSMSLPHLILRPEDVRGDATGYAQKLREFFSQINLDEPARLSDEEAWRLVKSRFVDGGHQSRFITNLSQFIGKAMRDSITPNEIRANAPKRLPNDSVGREFALIAADIFESYLASLKQANEVDQTASMVEALRILEGGNAFVRAHEREVSLDTLRSISVDEHQDFSTLFRATLRALAATSGAEVFTVGDDWQCINRFMGAEPILFNSFVDDWPNAVRLEMPMNYRSSAAIVSLGNALMESTQETPARASTSIQGLAALYFCDDLEQRRLESDAVKDIRGRALRRLLIRELSLTDSGGITVLTRTNHLPWVHMPHEAGPMSDPMGRYIDEILPGLESSLRSRIKTSTVHSYKGLESDSVIVLDVQLRSFPLIHTDIRFQSYFQTDPADLIEDERKLLYVAMTRPRSRLHLISRSDIAGPFLTGKVMRAVRSLNTMPSSFALSVTDSTPFFSPSVRAFLKEEGFLIPSVTRQKESKAWRDATTYVLNAGSLSNARLSWESDNPRLAKAFRSQNIDFDLIAEDGPLPN